VLLAPPGRASSSLHCTSTPLPPRRPPWPLPYLGEKLCATTLPASRHHLMWQTGDCCCCHRKCSTETTDSTETYTWTTHVAEASRCSPPPSSESHARIPAPRHPLSVSRTSSRVRPLIRRHFGLVTVSQGAPVTPGRPSYSCTAERSRIHSPQSCPANSNKGERQRWSGQRLAVVWRLGEKGCVTLKETSS